MKVLIIGFGNMGKTYANSFISSRFIKAEDINVLVRDASKSSNETPSVFCLKIRVNP